MGLMMARRDKHLGFTLFTPYTLSQGFLTQTALEATAPGSVSVCTTLNLILLFYKQNFIPSM